MKKSRKALSLILILVMCLPLLTACGNKDNPVSPSNAPSSPPSNTPSNTPSTAPSTPPPATIPPKVDLPPPEPEAKLADHITVITHEGVGVINVHSMAGTGAFTNNTYMMIHSWLVFQDRDGSFQPMLAASWDTADYQTWIFHIRDDVYFHNGDKLTTEDVLYTINLGKEKVGTTAYESWVYSPNVRAIDEYTLEIKLNAPYVDFLYHVSTPMTQILCKRALEEDPEKGYWIGTGPYKIAGFSTNDYVEFERDDNYWGPLPPTKSITFKYIPEPSSRAIMLENGQAQVAKGIPLTELPLFRNNPKFELIEAVQNNQISIQFNMEDSVCGDWNFRMAVASAIDRESLVALSGNYGIAISEKEYGGTIWGRITKYRNMSIPRVPYDLNKAKEYLAASPYDGTPVEFSYQTSFNRIGEALQEQLSKIGLNITLNPMDAPSFVAYTSWKENHAQMLCFATLLNTNPSSSYQSSFRPGSNNNRMRYDNQELTDLLAKIPSLTDEKERQENIYRMQEITAEDMPCIPVYWSITYAVAAKNVGGFTLTYSVFEDYRYIYFTLD